MCNSVNSNWQINILMIIDNNVFSWYRIMKYHISWFHYHRVVWLCVSLPAKLVQWIRNKRRKLFSACIYSSLYADSQCEGITSTHERYQILSFIMAYYHFFSLFLKLLVFLLHDVKKFFRKASTTHSNTKPARLYEHHDLK